MALSIDRFCLTHSSLFFQFFCWRINSGHTRVIDSIKNQLWTNLVSQPVGFPNEYLVASVMLHEDKRQVATTDGDEESIGWPEPPNYRKHRRSSPGKWNDHVSGCCQSFSRPQITFWLPSDQPGLLAGLEPNTANKFHAGILLLLLRLLSPKRKAGNYYFLGGEDLLVAFSFGARPKRIWLWWVLEHCIEDYKTLWEAWFKIMMTGMRKL